jgi:tRNA(Glu) U13 pseudouridine synthase TruD
LRIGKYNTKEKENAMNTELKKAENCFHVMEVLPYEPKGEYACIWYHAYERVGFEVLFVGTYDKCA